MPKTPEKTLVFEEKYIGELHILTMYSTTHAYHKRLCPYVKCRRIASQKNEESWRKGCMPLEYLFRTPMPQTPIKTAVPCSEKTDVAFPALLGIVGKGAQDNKSK